MTMEGKQDRTEYLSDLLGQAVCTALKDLDDLLVVWGVLCKANFQLPKKLATLLKSLLLFKLPEWKEGKRGVIYGAWEGLESTTHKSQEKMCWRHRGWQGSGLQQRDLFFFFGLTTRFVDLRSPIRDWTWAPAVKVPSPNHWTAREFPVRFFFFKALASIYLGLLGSTNSRKLRCKWKI